MAAEPGGKQSFTVTNRFRVTWNGIWLGVACAAFTLIGAALMLKGTASALVTGAIAVLIFGGGGLLASTRYLSRRPVLEFGPDGVCVAVPWPQARTGDHRLPWEDVSAIAAYTVAIPHRGDAVRHHYLAFAPKVGPGGAEPPTDLAADSGRPPGLDAPWELRRCAHIRSTWDASVEEIVAAARRFRPDLPFDDRRGSPHPSSRELP